MVEQGGGQVGGGVQVYYLPSAGNTWTAGTANTGGIGGPS